MSAKTHRRTHVFGDTRCAGPSRAAPTHAMQFLTRASPFEDVFKVKRRAGQKRQSTMPHEADASHFKRARSSSVTSEPLGDRPPVSQLMRSHGPPAGPVTRAMAPLPRPPEAGVVAFSGLPASVDNTMLLQMLVDARLPQPEMLDCRCVVCASNRLTIRPTSGSSAAALAQFARLADAAAVAAALDGRVIDGVEMRVSYQPRLVGPPHPMQYAPAPYQHYVPQPGPSYAAAPTQSGGRVSSGGSAAADDMSVSIDWNDDRTLAIRDRIVTFRDDGLRDELPFTRSLSSERRRIVRLIAHRLGLPHRTVGDDTYRQVVVYKPQAA